MRHIGSFSMIDTNIIGFGDGSDYLENGLVFWKCYAEGDIVCKRFPYDEWHKIAQDIDSDVELRDLLLNNPTAIRGFVLYDKTSKQPIAFSYILKEDKYGNVISFHGGGWNKGTRASICYFSGVAILIERLLLDGYKVRTYCLSDNLPAYRFMHSLGFRKYKSTDTTIYQWINLKNLYNSKIFQRVSQY